MKFINHLHALLIVLLALSPAAQAQVQSTSGLKLVATGPLKLVFQDAGLVNHGEFIPGQSTVIFKGNMSSSSISGSHPVSFFNLVVSKEGHQLELENNMSVSGTITLDKGNLQLNDHLLDLGYTGRINGERNESRIMASDGGTIKAMAVLNAPQAANPANLGVEITSPVNMGQTIILRGHNTTLTVAGKPVIGRYYDISPQYNTNLHATIRLYYLDAELHINEEEENRLSVFSSKNKQGSWIETGKDNMDVSTNWILKNDLDQLHRFTLAGATNKILAQQQSKTFVQLFPNPTADQFTVMLNSAEEKEAALNLYDQLGRLLESKRIQCKAGMNTISWNIGRYASGTYYLSFQNLDVKMVKIVKQ